MAKGTTFPLHANLQCNIMEFCEGTGIVQDIKDIKTQDVRKHKETMSNLVL